METAFVFPGQGSQYVGMGKSLAEKFAAARAVFDQADQALGFPLSQLCFEGPAETLQLTENMQPALLTVSMAAYENGTHSIVADGFKLRGSIFWAQHEASRFVRDPDRHIYLPSIFRRNSRKAVITCSG